MNFDDFNLNDDDEDILLDKFAYEDTDENFASFVDNKPDFKDEDTADFDNMGVITLDDNNDVIRDADGIDLLVQEIANDSSIDDLDSESEFDDAFSDNDSEEILESMVGELESKGFREVKTLSYNDIELLVNRAEVFTDDGKTIVSFINHEFNNLLQKFNDLCKKLNSSSATYVKRDDDEVKRTFSNTLKLTNKKLSGLEKPIYYRIMSEYGDKINEYANSGKKIPKQEIDEITEAVYRTLQKDYYHVDIVDENMESFVQYVEQLLDGILRLSKLTIEQNRRDDSFRYSMGKYLLANQMDLYRDIRESCVTDENGNVYFNIKYIKQLFRDNDKYSFICESCGETIILDDYVATCISFPLDNGSRKRTFTMPNVFKCKCGQRHTFMEKDLDLLRGFIKTNASSSINELTGKLIDISKGTSLLTYNIPITVLKSLWSYMIVDSFFEENKSTSSVSVNNEEIFNIQTVSDSEYEIAVKNFYTLLNTFDANKIPKVFDKRNISEDYNTMYDKETTGISKNPFYDFKDAQKENPFFSETENCSDQLNPFMRTDSNLTDAITLANAQDSDFADFQNTLSKVNKDFNFGINDKDKEIIFTYNKRKKELERSDLLSYKEIALYFCKVLSIDYKMIKNKALFSLIFSINNNKVMCEYLNYSNILRLKAVCKYINNSTQLLAKNVLPTDEQLVELQCIAHFYANNEQAKILENLDQQDVSYCKKLLNILSSEKEIILRDIEHYELERKRIILELFDCIEELSFTRIINISQFSLKDIADVLVDDVICKLFDKITDQMIISNYAEDFYDRFKVFGIFNKTTLKNSLTVGTKTVNTTIPLKKAIKNYCETHAISFSEVDMYKYFNLIDTMTQSKLSILKDLNKAFNDANYYEFCKVVVLIYNQKEKIDTLISKDYTNLLYKFIQSFFPTANKVISDYETAYDYYLQGFSKEEIALAKGYAKGLDFYRYMPNRKENESITDYIDRYIDIKNNSRISKYDSIDLGREFDNLTEYYGLLFSCSSLYETAYHSFTVATFITQLVRLISTMKTEKRTVCKILGMSEPILNLIDHEISMNNRTIDLDNLNTLLKTVSGIYITSVIKKIDPLISFLDEEVIKNTASIEDCINSIDVKDYLLKIATSDENTFIMFEDLPDNIDYSDAMRELLIFTEADYLAKYV